MTKLTVYTLLISVFELLKLGRDYDYMRVQAEVNISSYPAISVAGSFFFRRAEI